jgi:ribonuclease T2
MVNIPSLTSITGLLSQIPLGTGPPPPAISSPSFYSSAPDCPIDGPLSCHNTTVAPDSCCFIYPGGQLLQTQFWDTSPSVGPVDSWTLHGLWYVFLSTSPDISQDISCTKLSNPNTPANHPPPRPDLCDGSYPQFCHFAPAYHSITALLQNAGKIDLLAFMNTYWLPDAGSAENFWEHEWRKHGTCINTLAPSCYGEGYTAGDEVVDFFSRAVEIFKVLPPPPSPLNLRLCVPR